MIFAQTESPNEFSRQTIDFCLWPHAFDIRCILRALSQVRAELARVFSLAI
jgi:hypothetical protein